MTNDHIGEPKRRKGGLGTAGAFRGLAVAACLAVTTSLVSAPVAAHADPEPTAAEAQEKLDKLNEKVDQYVEKYNQIGEKLKIAKKKYKAANKSATEEQAKFDEQRRNVAQMAADAYKKGGDEATKVAGFASSENPQAILDQSAVFSLLSRERSSELTQFIATTQRLRREQAQAKRLRGGQGQVRRDQEAQGQGRQGDRQTAEAGPPARRDDLLFFLGRLGRHRRYLQRSRQRCGRDGAGLRLRPARQAVRVRRRGPGLLRLLGSHHEGLGCGGREHHAHDELAVGGDEAGLQEQPAAR
ncbi:coiled-coil domain-containing protein [Actinomadura sp. CNU-125]|uniref:coiled-coil domain-containing protein n=1 Tax=Actinomadura sp. CNU-125 TaxID=1904961 RepID=UPI0021CCA90D|nr:hypothetical protein [Actinomadura sp. CNU-125]